MKFLVMPGTVWQAPLVKRIKEMGYEVHICNPVKVSGVYELADCFLESDIFDYDKIIAYCKEEKIDLVMSEECDIATNAVAYLNSKIGANCISSEIAALFTNKYLMREFCKKHNFNPIPHRLCKSKEEAVDFYTEFGPKMIIKPIDSNASHGVFTVQSVEDVEKRFDESMKFSRNSKAVLLEKYIEGTEFTVDGLMTPKGHITLAISEKQHYAHNDNIACSLYFTQTNPKFDYTLLRKTNDELINKTGLPFGITHVEYKYQDGTFYLIEMAARGGGNLISAVIAPFMSGIDNYEYLIKSNINPDYSKDVTLDINNDKTAILKFLDIPCKEGRVKAIKGLDYLENTKEITDFKLNFKVGEIIKQPESDSVRIGFYIICADSLDRFNEITDNIKRKLIIELE